MWQDSATQRQPRFESSSISGIFGSGMWRIGADRARVIELIRIIKKRSKNFASFYFYIDTLAHMCYNTINPVRTFFLLRRIGLQSFKSRILLPRSDVSVCSSQDVLHKSYLHGTREGTIRKEGVEDRSGENSSSWSNAKI